MPFKRPTTTPTPDELFDEWLVELGEAELKIILYIIRRTMGFKKNADAISYKQFLHGITTRDGRVLDRGCGVRNRTNLARALARLEERTLIRSWKRTAHGGDADVTVYALRFEGDEEEPEDDPRGSPLAVPPWSSSGTTGGGPVAGPPRSRGRTTPGTDAALPVVLHRYPQETASQETAATRGMGVIGSPTGAVMGKWSDAPDAAEGDALALLLATGVGRARALDLCARHAEPVIRQQIAWLDQRRYDDRAACLVAAIEQGYGPPVASPRRRAARTSRDSQAAQPEAVDRYSSGPYGVCPACGCSPCDATCPDRRQTAPRGAGAAHAP